MSRARTYYSGVTKRIRRQNPQADTICAVLDAYEVTGYGARLAGKNHGKVEAKIGQKRCVFPFARTRAGKHRAVQNLRAQVRRTVQEFDPERVKRVEATKKRRAVNGSARKPKKSGARKPNAPAKEFDLRAAVLRRIREEAIALADIIRDYVEDAQDSDDRRERALLVIESAVRALDGSRQTIVIS